jgi:hypothetical protein
LNLNPLNLFKKKQKLAYPQRFAIVDYTIIAYQQGLRDDSVKVIYIYDLDEFICRFVDAKEQEGLDRLPPALGFIPDVT